MRVLQIVSSMDCGGLETFIMNVYRNIDRKKVQFDFLLHTEQECAYNAEIHNLGGKIYFVPPRNKGILKNKKALNSFFDNHREYSIVHMHESSLSYAEPLYAAKKNGIPVRIIHSHSTGFAKGNYIHKLFHKLHQFRLKSFATNYFACSHEAGRWMYGKTFKEVKFMRNGIEVHKYIFNNAVRREYRKAVGLQDKIVIGHIGRFAYPKNHKFLLEIFKEISKKCEKAVLLLVGGGILQDEIRKRAVEMKIEDRVIFLGVRSDIPGILQAMDIFVFPSIYEGLPVTLVEAQAAGLKCIVSDSVTKQVDLCNLIEYVRLEQSAFEWAEIIYNSMNYERINNGNIVKKRGFDIKQTANWLQQFYLNYAGENKHVNS